MVSAVQQALAREGIADEVLAAGQFNPRGHSGSMFAGGIAGDSLGGLAGAAGEAVGTAAGIAGGMEGNAELSGLPQFMLVGVTASEVYGFAGVSRSKVPEQLVFKVSREDLTVKVHQRTNVRVLELVHEDSGDRIELEGNRLPITHSKDVIQLLEG
jgi:hypothetical protein